MKAKRTLPWSPQLDERFESGYFPAPNAPEAEQTCYQNWLKDGGTVKQLPSANECPDEVLPPMPTADLPQRAKPRGLDAELQAMAKIDRILAELPSTALPRVLHWLTARYLPTDQREYRADA